MKYYFALLAIVATSATFAQKPLKTLKVTYAQRTNGNVVENHNALIVYATQDGALITSEKILAQTAETPYETTQVDVKSQRITQNGFTQNGAMSTIDSTSLAAQTIELTRETKNILGYRCMKAKTVRNSNNIDIWYTTEAGVYGGPSVLGAKLGLVLEIVRNGNYAITAVKVERNAKPLSQQPKAQKLVDALTYKDILWKSRFTAIKVFDKQVINFGADAKSNDSILRFASGTIAVKKVKFPKIADGSQVFVDVTEQSNGDAYDRTGSVFIIPTDAKLSFLDGLTGGKEKLPAYDNGNGKTYQGVAKTDNFEPLLELMRFFTPFGIHQYNYLELKGKVWQDSVLYRQDISDFISRLSNKEVYIGLNIGNYDKGGHRATVNVTIHKPETPKPRTVAIGLFNTNNVMEMAGQEYGTMFSKPKGLEVRFTLDKAVKNAKLRYITTGHGGWENGDEFVPKRNTIYLDSKQIFAFTPWRSDCGSYRLSNPASGNFENGLSSSDYSRSNWCPGTTTNPIWIDLGDLSAGEHTIAVDIPLGASEGTSFSAWNVSGVLVGEE